MIDTMCQCVCVCCEQSERPVEEWAFRIFLCSCGLIDKCLCEWETDLSHMCAISSGHCEFALIAVCISGRGGQAKGLIRARSQTQNTHVRLCCPGQTHLIVNSPGCLCKSIIWLINSICAQEAWQEELHGRSRRLLAFRSSQTGMEE